MPSLLVRLVFTVLYVVAIVATYQFASNYVTAILANR